MARLTKQVRDYWIERISSDIDDQVSTLRKLGTHDRVSMAESRLEDFMDLLGAKDKMDEYREVYKKASELSQQVIDILQTVKTEYRPKDESRHYDPYLSVPSMYNGQPCKVQEFVDFFKACIKDEIEKAWQNESDGGMKVKALKAKKVQVLDHIHAVDTDTELLDGLGTMLASVGINTLQTNNQLRIDAGGQSE